MSVGEQLFSEDVTGLLHEFVAVTAAFEFSRFDAVGDFALGDLLQQLAAVGFELSGRDVAARKP